MGKRNTYEDVKHDIESCGYKLLSNEYVNGNTKIWVQCDKGHEPYPICYKKWKEGRRCPICGGKKKLTYEQVYKLFKDEGYELLDKVYVRSKDKLKVKCPKGHIFESRVDRFKLGDRCPYCYGNKPLTIEDVRCFIESQGYKLISDVYKRREKLTVMCPKGHVYDVRYDSFHYGYRCPHCAESRGERRVREWLELNEVVYEKEKHLKIVNTKGISDLIFIYHR